MKQNTELEQLNASKLPVSGWCLMGEVKDLTMKHISTFSGGGGFDLAAEWAGWDNLASCEIDDFQNKILRYYWPDAYHHRDIKTLTWKIIDHEARKRYGINWRKGGVILTGGFPCQPFSQAGKRGGATDDRYLWPEMFRIIKEGHPDWVVAENVAGITSMAFPGEVSTMGVQADIFGETDEIHELRQEYILNSIINDLESEGYEVQPFVIPACAVGAPHRRDRIWIVANRDGNGQNGCNSKNEEHSTKGWEYAQCDFKRSNGERITTNPGSQRLQNRTPERNEPDREEEKQGWTIGLNDQTTLGMLPTPSVRDYKGAIGDNHMDNGTGRKHLDQLPNALKFNHGQTGQLNPLFVSEMMGFPADWTVLPFQNGETNP